MLKRIALLLALFASPATAQWNNPPPVVPNGPAGALETSNGTGGFSYVAPGANVSAALSVAINDAGGIPGVQGSITAGDCISWGPGVTDSGAPCGGYPSIAPTHNDEQWYQLFPDATAGGAASSPSTNAARCAPFLGPGGSASHVDALGVDVSAAGVGPVFLALYTDAIDATTHRHQPQSLIAAANSSLTVTAVGAFSVGIGDAGTGVPISGGLNWVCVNDPSSESALKFYAYSASYTGIAALIGSSTLLNTVSNANITSLTVSNTCSSGVCSWPSYSGTPFADSTTADMPLVAARIASVP